MASSEQGNIALIVETAKEALSTRAAEELSIIKGKIFEKLVPGLSEEEKLLANAQLEAEGLEKFIEIPCAVI